MRKLESVASSRVTRGSCYECREWALCLDWVCEGLVAAVDLDRRRIVHYGTRICLIGLVVENELVEVPIAGFDETIFSLQVKARRREVLTQAEANAAEVTAVQYGRASHFRVGRVL